MNIMLKKHTPMVEHGGKYMRVHPPFRVYTRVWYSEKKLNRQGKILTPREIREFEASGANWATLTRRKQLLTLFLLGPKRSKLVAATSVTCLGPAPMQILATQIVFEMWGENSTFCLQVMRIPPEEPDGFTSIQIKPNTVRVGGSSNTLPWKKMNRTNRVRCCAASEFK